LLLLPGVFFAVDLSCWHISMTHISAGLSTLLGNLSVVLVPLLGWLLFREPYNRANVPATLIALTGGALVCIVPDEKTLGSLGVSGNNYALGNALAASTAVAYASYQLAIHRARRRYGVLTVMCVSTTTTAVLLFALALLSGARIVPSDGRAWGALVALALVSHCLGQGLIAWGLGRLPAHLVALTLLWQPVCSALLSVVVLGQSMSPLQVFGCLLVISGLALVSLRGRTGRQARRRSAGAQG
jgi:drug/metabolite transporter (DMT)-like permease